MPGEHADGTRIFDTLHGVVARPRRPRQRRLRATLGALVSLALMAALGAVLARDAQRDCTGHTYQQAGVLACPASIREVGASFVVPRALGRPDPTAGMSEWIGVQGSSFFLQVGIVLFSNGGAPIVASTFWSDDTVKFEPQIWWPVEPGEVIKVRIVSDEAGWTAFVDDVDEGLSDSHTVRRQASADVAEWLYEDPGLHPNNVPLAETGSVEFSGLTLNDAPVPAGDLVPAYFFDKKGDRISGVVLRSGRLEIGERLRCEGRWGAYSTDRLGEFPPASLGCHR